MLFAGQGCRASHGWCGRGGESVVNESGRMR